MAERKTPTRPSSSKAPEVGGEVLVHYLESPNAIRTSVQAKVVAVAEGGGLLTVKLTRPGGRGPLHLERVPPQSPGALPCWEPLPASS